MNVTTDTLINLLLFIGSGSLLLMIIFTMPEDEQ